MKWVILLYDLNLLEKIQIKIVSNFLFDSNVCMNLFFLIFLEFVS
jgi:hypothetical protein